MLNSPSHENLFSFRDVLEKLPQEIAPWRYFLKKAMQSYYKILRCAKFL